MLVTYYKNMNKIIDCNNNTWLAVRSVNPNDANGNKDILYARFYLKG